MEIQLGETLALHPVARLSRHSWQLCTSRRVETDAADSLISMDRLRKVQDHPVVLIVFLIPAIAFLPEEWLTIGGVVASNTNLTRLALAFLGLMAILWATGHLSKSEPSPPVQATAQPPALNDVRHENRATVEAEFVTMIEEGKRLCEREFTDELTWSDFDPWWRANMGFAGTVLGDAERQRLIEVEAVGEKTPRNQITAVVDWLRKRRDNPAFWEAQVARLDRRELDAAITARRRPPLADRLDSLMREGMELHVELTAPPQAEETGEGEWAMEFGDAPPEWNDKADAFYKKARDLLSAEHPALLPDFEKGFNERLRIQRERETRKVASQQSDNRSQAQRTLDFATNTQRTPAKVVEACLEGISYARKAI